MKLCCCSSCFSVSSSSSSALFMTLIYISSLVHVIVILSKLLSQKDFLKVFLMLHVNSLHVYDLFSNDCDPSKILFVCFFLNLYYDGDSKETAVCLRDWWDGQERIYSHHFSHFGVQTENDTWIQATNTIWNIRCLKCPRAFQFLWHLQWHSMSIFRYPIPTPKRWDQTIKRQQALGVCRWARCQACFIAIGAYAYHSTVIFNICTVWNTALVSSEWQDIPP